MFLALLTLVLATQAPPPDSVRARPGTSCPARWSGLPFAGGQVYDGPPEENALLKPEDGDQPDDGISSWPALDGIYRAGRIVWLGCYYGREEAPLLVPVMRRVRVCRYVDRRASIRLYCR